VKQEFFILFGTKKGMNSFFLRKKERNKLFFLKKERGTEQSHFYKELAKH